MADLKVNLCQDTGNDADCDVAAVFLTKNLLIRLTDTDKNPLPFAKCRLVSNPETVITCDKNGIAKIPPPENGLKCLNLEWEPAGAEQIDPVNRFYWQNIFNLTVENKNDEACSTRLTHLGFCGGSLAEQVIAYLNWLGKAPGGSLNDIRDELVFWHDGGTYPGQSIESTGTTASTEASGQVPVDPDTPIEHFDICLMDINKKPMPGAYCQRIRHEEYNPDDEFIADGEGVVHIPVKQGTETIEIVWGPSDAGQTETGHDYCFQRILHLPIEGESEQNALNKILKNLEFEGDYSKQKYAFEQFFNYSLDDSVGNANSILSQWCADGPSSVSDDMMA